MDCKRIYLYEDRQDVYLDCYISAQLECRADEKKPAMLVLPGGGYGFCSDREAEPVAKTFMAMNMNAFVLYYSVNERAKFPRPLQEASQAMHIIRSRADEFHIDPDKVAAVGFSAGGHLVSSLGVLWHREEAYKPLGIPYGENKPNAIIASYPVITGDEAYTHGGTFVNLTGEEREAPLSRDDWSVEKHVTDLAAPAFIWHTATDDLVPVENSLRLAAAYSAAKVPYELHIFPEGDHGLSIATAEVGSPQPHAAQWVGLVKNWLLEIGLLNTK